MSQKELKLRVAELTYKHGLTHLSSCLNAVGIIDNIYKVKKENEPFILSQGHAALALYVVLEKYSKQDISGVGITTGIDAEMLIKKHGTHPGRDMDNGIWCSSGSLGSGITVAVGMALADRTRNVYVVISDGELAEGSVWEALKIAMDNKLENLRVTCISNGYSGYGKTEPDLLDIRLQYFYPTLMLKVNTFAYPDWVQGVQGHYIKMDEAKYKELIESL